MKRKGKIFAEIWATDKVGSSTPPAQLGFPASKRARTEDIGEVPLVQLTERVKEAPGELEQLPSAGRSELPVSSLPAGGGDEAGRAADGQIKEGGKNGKSRTGQQAWSRSLRSPAGEMITVRGDPDQEPASKAYFRRLGRNLRRELKEVKTEQDRELSELRSRERNLRREVEDLRSMIEGGRSWGEQLLQDVGRAADAALRVMRASPVGRAHSLQEAYDFCLRQLINGGILTPENALHPAVVGLAGRGGTARLFRPASPRREGGVGKRSRGHNRPSGDSDRRGSSSDRRAGEEWRVMGSPADVCSRWPEGRGRASDPRVEERWLGFRRGR